MSLANTQAKYEIVVTRTGSAQPVAQELENVARASSALSVSARASTAQLAQMKETALLTRESFRTLHATSALLGGHFLEVSLAGQAAVDSMKLLRGAAQATDTDMKTVGVGLVGVAAAVAIVTTAWQTMSAQMGAQNSVHDLGEGMNKQAAAASKSLNLLREQGKISETQWMALNNQLAESIGNYEKQRAAIMAIRAVDPSKAQTEDEVKLADLRASLTAETLDGYKKETFAATETYVKRKKQIDDLYNDMLRFNGGKKDTGTQALDNRLNQQALDAAAGRIDSTRQQSELEKTLEFQSLGSSETRIQQAEREFTARIALYQKLAEEYPSLEDSMTQATQDASLKRLQIMQQESDKTKLNIKSIGEQMKTVQESFASGLSQAIVEFANHTKDAKTAFLDFARSFLSEILKMILEQQILNALKAIGTALGNGGIAMAANGGTFGGGGARYAANGIQTVSQPTFFPKFNVIAGEAGREMLTVLARPRLMSIGGMEAVVGDAGGRKLAITDPAALGGGSGGTLHIRISHSEESKAEIIENSVKRSELHLTRQSKNNTPFRAAIREGIR